MNVSPLFSSHSVSLFLSPSFACPPQAPPFSLLAPNLLREDAGEGRENGGLHIVEDAVGADGGEGIRVTESRRVRESFRECSYRSGGQVFSPYYPLLISLWYRWCSRREESHPLRLPGFLQVGSYVCHTWLPPLGSEVIHLASRDGESNKSHWGFIGDSCNGNPAPALVIPVILTYTINLASWLVSNTWTHSLMDSECQNYSVHGLRPFTPENLTSTFK